MSWLVLATLALGCEPVDVSGVMDEVGAALASGRPDAGLDHLEQVWQRLPDACEPVVGPDLALIAQRAGALAWDLGRAGTSDAWFESACRVAPGEGVPASLGPTAAERGRAACERVATHSRGDVVTRAGVVLDGARREPGATISLPIGVHVLTWEEDGGWRGRWQTVEDGVPIEIPSGTPILPPAVPPALARPKLVAPLALAGGGVALAGAGVAVLQLAFIEPWNSTCVGYGFGDGGWKTCEAERGVSLAPGYYGGIGLIAGGAALGLTGVGLGVHVFLTPGGSGLALHLPL